MSGFEQLPGAISAPLGQIPQDQVAFADEAFSDTAALSIVINDVNKAESYIQSKSLPTEWDHADDLYRAFVKPKVWPGTEVPRSNLGMPLVLETMENLLPAVHLAFFSDKQPFLVNAKGKTSGDAARAIAKVLVWASKQAGFKEEIRRTLKSTFQYGFGVAKYGWETKEKKVKEYRRKSQPVPVPTGIETINVPTEESDEVVAVETVHLINQPTFENVELRNLLVDPSNRVQDIRRAKYVIHQVFITADDLDSLADNDCYQNVPTRDELAMILSSKSEPATNSLTSSSTANYRELQAAPQTEEVSLDPLQQPLELLEYWTDDRVITVLQRKIVIRNEANTFGVKPFLSCAFIDVIGSMFGFGVAKLLSGEQKLQQGVINSWIDNLALQLNPAYQTTQGIGTGAQQNVKMSPGKVINSANKLEPLATPSVSTEAMNAVDASELRSSRRVGSNGADAIPTQAMRTAEGVSTATSGIAARTQYFVEQFADLVFVPALEAFVSLCKDNLKPSQINLILTEEDGKAYQGDVLDVYNGTYGIEILSSTKLAGRRAMASMLPFLLQLFQSEPVQDSLTQQAKKIDYTEVLKTALDIAGWDSNNWIADMTADDKKRATQMTSPAAVKAMSAEQALQQKHQFDLEDIQATGEARAGNTVIRHMLDESAKDGTQITGLV